ncbi:MAG: histidine phosphatase family protein, partial [Pseudomonadota bacterium]
MTDVSLRSNQCMSLDCCWLLVRHGETDWNIQNRFQGRENTQLNENGRAQMFAAGASLKQDVDSDRSVVVHTSSLARARESAEIIARGTRWQVRTSELFDEMDLGAWEGEPYDIVNDSPDWLELAPHGGETEKMFQR